MEAKSNQHLNYDLKVSVNELRPCLTILVNFIEEGSNEI